MILNTLLDLILIHLAEAKRATVQDLAKRTLPKRSPPAMRRRWDSEIEMGCELLVLRRLVSVEASARGKVYVAGDRALRMFPVTPGLLPARIAGPMAAVMTLSACATAPAGTPSRSYWGDNAGKQPRASEKRIAQLPNGAVYRLCYDDCPQPTVKMPARPIPPVATAPVVQSGSTIPPMVLGKVVDGDELRRQTLVAELNRRFGAGNAATPAATAAPKTTATPTPKRKYVAKPVPVTTATLQAEPEAPTIVPVPPPEPVNALPAAPPEPGPYVDPKQDPNAFATPEERARLERMMEELKRGGATSRSFVAKGATGAPQVPDMVATTTEVSVAPSQTPPRRLVAGALPLDPKDFVLAWAAAWSARDSDRYFAFYGKDYVPYSAGTTQQFMANRRAVIARSETIQVNVTPLNVVQEGERVVIRFWQQYRSNYFQSRVQKTIDLVRQDGEWRIQRERIVNPNQAGRASA